MSSRKSGIKKIEKGVRTPALIKPWLKNKKQLMPYYLRPGGTSYDPANVAICVNSVCNLRCIMCDVGQKKDNFEYYKNLAKNGGDLPLEKIKEVLDEISDFKPAITIHSTEPLLYKNLMELSKHIIGLGLDYSITTNGYLLEKFAEELVQIGLPTLNVSIDGPAEVHNRIRGVPDSFERAARGIRKVVEYKKKLGKKKPDIYLSSVISGINAGRLVELGAIAKDFGAAGLTLTHLNFIDAEMARAHNRMFNHVCTISPSSIAAINPKDVDLELLFRNIRQLKHEHAPGFIRFSPDLETLKELDTYYNHPEKPIAKEKCFVPWKNAQILANGDVIPAARCFHVVMGNIYENSFKDIWNGEKFRNFRKELRKVGTTPACYRCCGIFG